MMTIFYGLEPMMSASRKIFIFCLVSLFPFKIEPCFVEDGFLLFVCFFWFISNFVMTVSLNSSGILEIEVYHSLLCPKIDVDSAPMSWH